MSKGRTRRLAAVWFADIVGYTRLSSQDEDAALAVVDELQSLCKSSVAGTDGRVVKFMGDGVLSVFDSANAALSSAMSLMDAFARSDVVKTHRCSLSIGVHLGEVVEGDDGDVYGDGVNTASRIEGVASAGQVVVSEDVYRQIRNRPEYSPRDFGAHNLKGLEKPLALYLIKGEGEPPRSTLATAPIAASTVAATARGASKSHRPYAVGTTVAVAGFAILTLAIGYSVEFSPLTGGGEPTSRESGAVPEDDDPDRLDLLRFSVPPAGADPGLDPVAPDGPATTRDQQRDVPGDATSREPATQETATQETATQETATQETATGETVTREVGDPGNAAVERDAPPPTVETPAEALPPGLVVIVYGDGAGARLMETALTRTLARREGVRTLTASSLAVLRGDDSAVRSALAGDFASLSELARQEGAEFMFVGEVSSSAAQARGPFFSGSADLSLTMYRVSTGEIFRAETFHVGSAGVPGKVGRNEQAARTEAVTEVGRAAAQAARTWLARALR